MFGSTNSVRDGDRHPAKPHVLKPAGKDCGNIRFGDLELEAALAWSKAHLEIACGRICIAAWVGYISEIYGVGRALMALMDSDAEARSMRHSCKATGQGRSSRSGVE
ncbi:hypothetical protein [Primorskyibacter sp. 2E233]|uniref:hypothetical protein n=1 Tax=Primorskyibacter sp. 2E233 TaxID=3413431 RepID=UPI003BEF7410